MFLLSYFIIILLLFGYPLNLIEKMKLKILFITLLILLLKIITTFIKIILIHNLKNFMKDLMKFYLMIIIILNILIFATSFLLQF